MILSRYLLCCVVLCCVYTMGHFEILVKSNRKIFSTLFYKNIIPQIPKKVNTKSISKNPTTREDTTSEPKLNENRTFSLSLKSRGVQRGRGDTVPLRKWTTRNLTYRKNLQKAFGRLPFY